MEGELEFLDPDGVPEFDGLPQPIVDRGQLGERLVVDVVDGPSGQLLGDPALQPEDVVDVVAAQRGDDVAAVGDQLHESLAPQGQQSLADGGHTHAEFGRGLVEADELARAHAARHDHIAHVHRDVVGQLGTASEITRRPGCGRGHDFSSAGRVPASSAGPGRGR